MEDKMNMRISLLALICIAAVANPAAALEGPEQTYQIDANIIAIDAGQGRECTVVCDSSEYKLQDEGGVASFSQIRELVCGDVRVTTSDNGTLLWNDAENPPAGSALELISSPRMVVVPGKKVIVNSGSCLEYFSPGTDGSYRHGITGPDESPGLRLGATVTAHEEAADRYAILDVELRLAVLEGREDLPGINLDVGPPLIRVQETGTSLLLALDEWHLVSGHLVTGADGGAGDFLLVLLRVKRLG
jgi:hypothetical protein